MITTHICHPFDLEHCMQHKIMSDNGIEYTVDICDICSQQVSDLFKTFRECRICGRKLCSSCVKDTFCPDCYPFGKDYTEKCDTLYKDLNKQQKALWTKAKEQALEYIRTKKENT